MATFTVIDDGAPSTVDATVEPGVVRVTSPGLQRALGWELKPEGLCRGDVCIPVAARPGLVVDDAVDIAGLASLLDRAIALDVDERVAYLGRPAPEQGRLADTLEAPDFTLPDLTGSPHSLSDYLGSKVLLAAWASW